ncbi:hypothetical protein ACSMX9_20100 [Streptomyces sp. LE64]|uniref:hypothetical protein n=1 Tax=Streptomyces sp. LE64 TaxID=3448653 RepID=UPI0040424902
MSHHDELTAVRHRIDDLTRTVDRLVEHVGHDVREIRRLRTDLAQLHQSVDLLHGRTASGEEPRTPRGAHPSPAPRHQPAPRPDEVVWVPDTPYDSSLWTDADDEGLGALHRHAP